MKRKNVLHIHPHVMGSDHRDHHSDQNPFHHFFHRTMKNSQNQHSFSATYSNVNGHVTRHFNQDGRSVGGRQAKDAMQEMNRQMKQMDRQMNAAFGDFGHMMGISDDQPHHHENPFRRLMGHHRKHGNLTHRIKRG